MGYGKTTAVVSDIHLGARNSRPTDLLRFLDEHDPDRLIINGDLFDSPQFGELRDDELRLVEALRERAEQSTIDFIKGNHDPKPHFFKALLGFECHHELILSDLDDGPCLVSHGDRWDHSMSWPAWIIRGADYVYGVTQKVDRSHSLARQLKHRCKWFTRVVHEVRVKAAAEATRREFGSVVVGHTHVFEDRRDGPVRYINTGCWTERPMGYAIIRDGQIEQRLWTPPTRAVVGV
ncbi:MAG: metallophosphoesterase family protein [Tepidisphaeraceae bacterium]